MIGVRNAVLAIGVVGALVGCTDADDPPSSAPLVGDSHAACDGIDICRPCDPQDFMLGPDGTNRCGFVLRYREVAKMGAEPIAYQGADTATTWWVAGANPDGSPIIETAQLSGESAFTASHHIAQWDGYFRSYATDPPIGEWVTARSLDEAYTIEPTLDPVIPATGSSDGNPRLPIVRCGDQGMTVEVTWPHAAEGPITDCDCDRILRETARRYAEYHHLDRHVVQVSSFSYAPSQYLRDDYASQPTSPREGLRVNPPPKRRVIRATDGPNTPAITEHANVYTITLHTVHPQAVKSDAKVFAPDKAIIGFRAYNKNREGLVRLHNYFTNLAMRADAPKDTKNRIIYKVEHDVIIGSGPLAGVLATHLPDAVVIDDGEKRHIHRNNTRIIQNKEDVSWARHLGPEKPNDFVEASAMVGEGPMRHVHVGMAAEQLFKGKELVPGKITKIETVDGEVHLELKVDNVANDTFVIHVPKTKRVWVLTGPPETEPADYTVDTKVPTGLAAKLREHKIDTEANVHAFVTGKVHTNNEWYDLPHDEIRTRVNNRHVFVFGTGGGGLQALGQITDGNGGEGEVARAKKVTIASFDGGILAASADPATQPGGGQANAFKALKTLAGVADGDAEMRPTTTNVIYGHRVAGARRQAPVQMDKVSVELHDPGDGTGERPMLRFKIKRPKMDGSEGLPDVEVYADEVIWSLPGPGKSDLELDASVIKSFTIAMDGQVPLGASAVSGRVRFVASNAMAGILAKLESVKDVAPDAGTVAELADRYQKALVAMRGKPVNGALVDKNSTNEGTLMNQMRYVPPFVGWSPP